MKKLLTKALGVVLSLAVAVSFLAPTTALAADNVQAPKNVTIYRTSKNGTSYDGFYVTGLTKSQKIKKSTVKSKNSKVVALDCIERHETNSGYLTEFFNGAKDNGYSWEDYEYYIGLELKKAGTAKIEYKIDNKKYETKVTVKNYENPLKTIKITGINSGKNIASKLNKQNSAELKLKKSPKDAVINLTSNKNWKVTNVYFRTLTKGDYGYSTTEQISYSSYNGRSTVKLNVGDLSKKGAYQITIISVNTKNGATMYNYFYVNY